MKRKNATRNALFTSIISLLLCVSMLVGTTFAWFTDSVVSGNNVIAAGNLDIELYNDGNKVTSSTNLFENVLWEPGVAIYENFTIKNEGNLALLYDFAINWGDYNTLAGQYNLTQILKVAMVDGHVSGNREAVIAKGEGKWAALDTWSFSGEMTKKGDTKDFALIIYWEPSDNDNNWNVQNGKTLDKGDHLYVNLGINLQATQKMHESDSFGPDYDGLASDWDGSVGEVPAEQEGVITITTGAELAAFAAAVNGGNSYSGKTVVLGADIDLDNKVWTPIGQTGATQFAGTFDGNGKTIYNLNIDNTANTSEYGAAGLFGWVEQHSGSNSIKNLTINGVTINSHRYSGAVAGWINIPVTNCTVKNVTINCSYYNDDTDGTKVGALVGYADNKSALTGNTVDTAILNAYGDVGGLAGVAQTTVSVDGNTVKNVKINYISDVKSVPGEIVSTRVAPVMGTNTAANVTITHVIATQADFEAAVAAGQTEIVLAAGNYVMPDGWTGAHDTYNQAGYDDGYDGVDLRNKTLTIIGSRNAVIDAKGIDSRDQFVTGATLAFEGVTMNFGTNNYMGFMNTASLTYKDCAVNGLQFFGAPGPVAFVDCDLNSNGAEHSVWTWSGDKNISFTDCDFTYADRAVNCYGQNGTTSISFTDCTFTKVAGKETTGAIETNSADLTALNLTINNCTVNEGDLWWVSTWDGKGGANTYTTVDGKVTVGTAKQLAAVVAKGATEIYLMDGEYDMPNFAAGSVNGVKFVGTGTDTVIKLYNSGSNGDFCLANSTATFEQVKIVTEIKDWAGFQNATHLTFNKCEFENNLFLSGSATFNECHFVVTTNHYNVWAYSANSRNYTAEFNTCVFDCAGKSIYVDGNAGGTTTMKFTGCTFNDNDGGATDKAAIETGTTYGAGATYKIEITGCVFNGFAINPNGANTNSTIWANKNSMPADKLNIIIDGVEVY